MNVWLQWRYFLSLSRDQRGAQAGHQGGGPDTLGSRQQAELGSDLLHPAGAGECSHRYAVRPLQLQSTLTRFSDLSTTSHSLLQ